MNPGSVGKLFFRFDNPWWEGNGISHSMFLGWDVNPNGPRDENIDPKDWTKGVMTLSPARGQPDLLIAWVDGVRSKVAETLSDEKVTLETKLYPMISFESLF